MNNVAILVGCQYYRDSALHNLNGVNSDVKLMREALINYCGCDQGKIFELTSEIEDNYRPSGGDILDKIQAVANKLTDTEIHNLFFYYSGHGTIQNSEPHLLPSDAIPKRAYGNIAISTLKDTLDDFNMVKHIIIILDICQSEYTAKGNEYVEIDSFFSKSTIIFYSCSPHQNSYMLATEDGEGSIYTKFLVDALSSPKRSSTIKDISEMVKGSLSEYCTSHGISQNPHTETFDLSLADIVVANNRNTPYSIAEKVSVLDLNKSIWLIDAEKADGDETRFKTFTDTTLVKQFIEKKSEFWGIASVKGIGKTFLLQVKRVKMSKIAHCFPHVKACKDNNWATECIKFTDAETSIQSIKNYADVKLLWKYSLICYIFHCWLEKQKNLHEIKKNKQYRAILQWIEDRYQENSFSKWTYQFLTDESFNKLQLIFESVIRIGNWPSKIAPEYITLQRLGRIIISAIADTSKKSLILFLDKIDQAMRQPNSEDALDCECCSKKELVLTCGHEKKGSSYCTDDVGDTCWQRALCCYGCETYSDPYAGTGLRIKESDSLRNSHCNYWQRLQLALIDAVTDVRSDFDGRIKVIYTVRLEACNFKESIWGDQRAKIMALTCILDYSRDEQKKIYRECIEHQDRALLYLPELAKRAGSEDKAFVGVSKICHPYVQGASESIFDIIYRHSFGRTRDIQDYGQALTARIQDIKASISEDERGSIVKQIIEETAARLAYSTNKATRSTENSYYFEKMPNMPSYWADPENFERLMNSIDRNLLFLEDMQQICRTINQLEKCPGDGCKSCLHHPFSTLKNLGMLGYIVLSENGLKYSIQQFLGAKDITYFHDEDSLQINDKTMYLVHPALTKSIEKLRNDRKIMHFCGFLIGRDIQVQQSVLRTILEDKQLLTKREFEKTYYRFVDFTPLLE